MKINKQLLHFLIVSSVFAGCKKAPTACFKMNKATAAINEPIICDARCSVDAKTYNWLGSGIKIPGNAEGSIDTIKFNIKGVHSIKLEVTNGNKMDMVSHNVTIE